MSCSRSRRRDQHVHRREEPGAPRRARPPPVHRSAQTSVSASCGALGLRRRHRSREHPKRSQVRPALPHQHRSARWVPPPRVGEKHTRSAGWKRHTNACLQGAAATRPYCAKVLSLRAILTLPYRMRLQRKRAAVSPSRRSMRVKRSSEGVTAYFEGRTQSV